MKSASKTSLAKRLAALAAAALLVSACATAQRNPKSTIGGLGGAAAGGLIASAAGGNTAAIVGGVLLGGLLGGAVGNALDQRDKELALKEAQLSLESARTGHTSTWRNPDSGNSGTFTPTRTYQEPDGRYCREYQQEIVVGGERHKSFGTACRMPDGTWQVQ